MRQRRQAYLQVVSFDAMWSWKYFNSTPVAIHTLNPVRFGFESEGIAYNILVANSARMLYLRSLDAIFTFQTTKHGRTTRKISVMMLIEEMAI